jgi:adenosylhomocysteine nucleosidase
VNFVINREQQTQYPIAVVSALAEEQAGLIERLFGREVVQHAGREFITGQLVGRPVVLALCRIGKVAAATTAAALIERFQVGALVFTGVAGGLAPEVRVGDAVVSTDFVQHDLDVSPLFPRFEVPLYGRSHFNADDGWATRLVTAALQAGGQLHAPERVRTVGDGCWAVHMGTIASGDQFVGNAQASQALRKALPHALCVEMEGAAIAQTCFDYGVPFAAIRTISDRADDAAHLDFAQFVHTVAGPRAVAILLALLAITQTGACSRLTDTPPI